MKRRPEHHDSDDKRDQTSASDADRECFARAMAGVVRLKPDPRGRVRTSPHIDPPHINPLRLVPLSGPSFDQPDTDESSDAGFVAPGVDRRELRKLKRGEHAPSSRLDLHGMTVAEAVASVKRLIENGRRHRCVCIVHGQGLHSVGNVSILKTRVREWLRQHRAVLAYADAARADGGAGAVYVLLRK